MCARMICNLLFLKTGVSLHIFLVERDSTLKLRQSQLALRMKCDESRLKVD